MTTTSWDGACWFLGGRCKVGLAHKCFARFAGLVHDIVEVVLERVSSIFARVFDDDDGIVCDGFSLLDVACCEQAGGLWRGDLSQLNLAVPFFLLLEDAVLCSVHDMSVDEISVM